MNAHDVKILQKIIIHAQKVMAYIKECNTYECFAADEMRVEACVFNIMQIGELAHTDLSQDAKDYIYTIPWHKIYGLRNRIVHGYETVSMIVIWEVATQELAPLISEIEKYLN